MSKISASFLVGFSALTFAGAALADETATAAAAAGGLQNALSGTGASLSRMGQSAVKLNPGTTDLQRSASALTTTSSASALKNVTADNIASAKIGAAPTGGRPSADSNIFANALPSAGVANALRIGDAKPNEIAPTANSMGVLGMGGGNLGEALGSQRVNAGSRIGGK